MAIIAVGVFEARGVVRTSDAAADRVVVCGSSWVLALGNAGALSSMRTVDPGPPSPGPGIRWVDGTSRRRVPDDTGAPWLPTQSCGGRFFKTVLMAAANSPAVEKRSSEDLARQRATMLSTSGDTDGTRLESLGGASRRCIAIRIPRAFRFERRSATDQAEQDTPQ